MYLGVRASVTTSLAVAFISLGLTLPGQTATITGWDFEDQTLQGWTNVLSSTTGPITYDIRTASGSGSWRPLDAVAGERSMVAVTEFGSRDGEQDSALLLRSPEFKLTGQGQISAHLLGGDPKDNATSPSSVSDVANATPSPDAGYLGIALRRVSDDAYPLTASRTSDSSGGWQQVVFSESELNALYNSDPAGTKYTLDLVDWAHSSSWSSIALDSVSVPVDDSRRVLAGGGGFEVLTRYAVDPAFGTFDDALDLLALDGNDPAIAQQTVARMKVIDMHDGGANGHFAENAAYNGGGGDNIATIATGTILVTSPGEVTFGFYANDGGRLMIDGVLVAEDLIPGVGGDTLGTINLDEGSHSLEFIHFENNGAATVELYVATTNGTYTAFDQANFMLVTAVPEPTAVALCLAMAGIGAWRTRFRSRRRC